MQWIRFDQVQAFSAHVLPTLLRHEAENNLMIGILARGVCGDAADWLMATVEEDGEIQVMLLMTPPHNLILACADAAQVPTEALRVLAQALEENGVTFPGLFAQRGLAEAFAALYTRRCGGAFAVEIAERAYVLRAVADVPRRGVLRAAQASDMCFLPYWLKEFERDVFGQTVELCTESAQRHIESGSLFVLTADGMPVCIAGAPRKTPHGRSIGPVYTPPFLRGRGYATDCTAQLSRRLLAEGNDFCVLFADIANPASNGAYIRAGYRAIGDFLQMKYKAE